MSVEENPVESSSYDKNDESSEPGVLSTKSIFASAVLLLLPAGIPVLFIPTAESRENVWMLVGMSAVIMVLNSLLLLTLVRWFKQLRED